MLWDHSIGIDDGYCGRELGVARTCLLGNIAHLTGERIYWDDEKREIINNKEANKYLVPEYRSPWVLPKYHL
jgi:hypothetical protein